LKLDPDRLPAALEAQAVGHLDGHRVLAIQRHAEIPDVMIALRQAGIAVDEMELLQPDLEEAFVQIMARR
jgi:hypothetical protein